MKKILRVVDACLLLAAVLIPTFIMFKNKAGYNSTKLTARQCVSKPSNIKELCLSCLTASEFEEFQVPKRSVIKQNGDFFVLNIPKANRIRCAEILQMMNYEDVDKLKSVTDIQFENIKEVKEIIRLLKFSTTSPVDSQAAVNDKAQHIVVVEVLDKLQQSKLSTFIYMSQSFENQLKKAMYLIALGVLTIIIGLIVKHLQQNDKEKLYKAVFHGIIAALVFFITSQSTILGIPPQSMENIVKLMFLGLIFTQVTTPKFVIAILLVLFTITGESFWFIWMMFLSFCIYCFYASISNRIQNLEILGGVCLFVIIGSVYIESLKSVKYSYLPFLIDYICILTATLLISINWNSATENYEKIPNSSISLPGFEETINEQEE